ncbi:Eco57I restriction-modification methylase domain-containing protein [Bifidobacterium cuniculi]|uniref:site-specific DNA-methyltransferase (adenine-specific) n=1 Tax=Bifidobacterium cuniculi TaxID=1688 RepID=A0A087AYP2_9BIFI|nr:Eco57I restriction-modification methylase domain-containing protein [Bifidobacterium cuniculi]KFI63892.1 Modification methylase [Bifidobacterium cuniculi]
MLSTIAQIRNNAAKMLSSTRQQELEQFLTPENVARQAVSLFTSSSQPIRALDLGSGSGILGAFLMQSAALGSSVTAVEQDSDLATLSEESLDEVCSNVTVINASIFDIFLDAEYDRVILNPPYRKISPMTISTSGGGVKVTNLYTAFLVTAVQSMREGGECVAIIPRSWMNGEYFKDFRQWLFGECSIDVLAVYDSRQDHFRDMNILQEIMLLKISKGPQHGKVTVYSEASPNAPLIEQPHDSADLSSLLVGRNRILRIHQEDHRLARFSTLDEVGLWVSTGKLVWFRNRDILHEDRAEHDFPLYWSDNQHGLSVDHPVVSDREQWVAPEAERRKVVLPPGSYVLVNRFSAKEQSRRIQASYLCSDVAFVADNKLNYIHAGTSRKTVPLDTKVAQGLTLWLSSTIIDQWYREISGSTQVNATDLRHLPSPPQSRLIQLSNRFSQLCNADQANIDTAIEEVLSWSRAS